MCDRRVEIAVDPAELPDGALDDATFWYVGVHDQDGRELYRHDADRAEIEQLLRRSNRRIALLREFESQAEPDSWTVIPHSPARGWLTPLHETINGSKRSGADSCGFAKDYGLK